MTRLFFYFSFLYHAILWKEMIKMSKKIKELYAQGYFVYEIAEMLNITEYQVVKVLGIKY